MNSTECTLDIQAFESHREWIEKLIRLLRRHWVIVPMAIWMVRTVLAVGLVSASQSHLQLNQHSLI